MTGNIEIIRSRRRTVAIEIKRDLRVVVRAPLAMPQDEIERFVFSKREWLHRHLDEMRSQMSASSDSAPITECEIKEMTERAEAVLPQIVGAYANEIGVHYGRITVRSQTSRWGSCSSKGNLSFNCLLMLCPDEVTEYVVIHELCHLVHMDHSREFWALVESHCSEYRKHRAWLRENGGALISRLRKGKNI